MTDHKTLIEDARAYAGDDEYGGAVLLREVADALESQRSRIAALEAVIGALQIDDPSAALDQMIREAKADAWDAGFMRLDDWMVTHVIDTDGAKAPDRSANPYRNGDA